MAQEPIRPSAMLTFSVCPIPRSTYTTFMDEGKMHFKAGKYRKALFCFDRALGMKPGNKAALVHRSQCHLKLGDAEAALKDAQESFDTDETFIQGLYQYAEALFNLGQFEQAAICYHRGFRARRDREEFRIGINKAQCAIRRAIGDRQATQIEDLDQIIFEIDKIQNDKGNAGHCCVLDRDSEIELRRNGPKKKALSKARARWVDREILGVLQHDKNYLTNFLKRPDIEGNQSGSEALKNSANEALKYLDIQENLWRQQNPMYARKIGLNFNNDIVIQYEKQEQARMEQSRRIKMDAAQGAMQKNLQQIEHALQIGRAQDCQLECDRALRQIKEISVRVLPRKPEFVTEILHFKGLALLKLKVFDGAVAAFQEELNVATQNKMTDVKSRALDYLGRSFAMKGSFAEAAEVWDTRLAIAKTPVERAYLYHEIGRCYYELNKFELSKIYGNQSLDEAMKIDDYIWAMNATILLGQCEVKTKSFDKALEQFEKANGYAMKCGNKGNVSLLHEAEHCLKIYLEKQATETDVNAARGSQDPDKNSDEDDMDPLDIPGEKEAEP